MMGLFQPALKENTQKEVCLRLNAPPHPLIRFLVCGHLCVYVDAGTYVHACDVSARDYSVITQDQFIQKKAAFSFPIKPLVELSIGL